MRAIPSFAERRRVTLRITLVVATIYSCPETKTDCVPTNEGVLLVQLEATARSIVTVSE